MDLDQDKLYRQRVEATLHVTRPLRLLAIVGGAVVCFLSGYSIAGWAFIVGAAVGSFEITP